MKSRCLVLLLTSTVAFATTLTVNIHGYDMVTLGRSASLTVTDGNSTFDADLFHYIFEDYVPLGYCRTPGDTMACNFMPGGAVLGNDVVLDCCGKPFPVLNLNGTPIPLDSLRDFAVSFAFYYGGGSAIHGQSSIPWGPQSLNAELRISIVRLSTGECVFCAHAPTATAIANGIAFNGPYPFYSFDYSASGPIIPEPGNKLLFLAALAPLLLIYKDKNK